MAKQRGGRKADGEGRGATDDGAGLFFFRSRMFISITVVTGQSVVSTDSGIFVLVARTRTETPLVDQQRCSLAAHCPGPIIMLLPLLVRPPGLQRRYLFCSPKMLQYVHSIA